MLIYGLPNDNYDNWFKVVTRLGKLKKAIPTPIRVDFKITDFEPCNGTPLFDAPEVNFTKKNEFLPQWIACLKENGLMAMNKDERLHTMSGLIGRRECVYKVMMSLRKRDTSITDALLSSFKNGVNRWLYQRDADSFLNKL